jgi:two-component system, cell cycle sensor histidine kinase and response regulator CckA
MIKNKTILIIDDEKLITEIISQSLELSGYKSIVTNTGNEGLVLYNKYKDDISVVILDVILKDMSGCDIYKELINIDNNIKVLFTSGIMNKKKINRYLTRNDTAFIQKPFSIDELKSKIKKLTSETL